MDIDAKDVESVSTVGELNGDHVKMVKTHGGLYLLVGKKDKNSKKPDALSAASHKALAIHQVEKEYGKDFRLSLQKSEHEQIEVVTEIKVSSDLEKDSLNLYKISKNGQDTLVLTRYGISLLEGEISNGRVSSVKVNKMASDTLEKNAESIAKNIERVLKK